jgi:hypothetical protein
VEGSAVRPSAVSNPSSEAIPREPSLPIKLSTSATLSRPCETPSVSRVHTQALSRTAVVSLYSTVTVTATGTVWLGTPGALTVTGTL